MTYGASLSRAARGHRARSRHVIAPGVFCAAALTLGASFGFMLLYANPPADKPLASPPRLTLHAAQPPAKRTALPLDPSFTAPSFTAGYAPVTFAQNALPKTAFVSYDAPDPPGSGAPLVVAKADVVSAVKAPVILAAVEPSLPTPTPRPTVFVPVDETAPAPTGRRRMAQRTQEAVVAVEPPKPRGMFDRLFGRSQPPGVAMSYAAPEDTGFGAFGASRSAPDRLTAVYDIAAHTVTLPDGTSLEAHSGLGSRMDDPRGVAEHMRGATPPAIYDLQPREALFHGVRALRLNPVGGAPYGRLGLLAHTYMLGPRGDSNGCVVFRDYQAFRRAYDNGQVRRLVVIAGRA